MRQFVLPDSCEGGPECRLDAREARHLLRVLRLGEGDSFPAVDRAGRRYDCLILSAGDDGIRLSLRPRTASGDPLPDLRGGGGRRQAAPEGEIPSPAPETGAPARAAGESPRIVLAAALLKGENFDLVVRQATEAGVSRLIPLRSSRVVRAGELRAERIERVLRAALAQSGSAVPTRVEEPCSLGELPARLGKARGNRLCLLLHEAPLAEASLHGLLCDSPDEIVLATGPEGGFAPDEVDFLLAKGFRPLRLPGAVLRAETAALYAIAATQTILSERNSWRPAPG